MPVVDRRPLGSWPDGTKSNEALRNNYTKLAKLPEGEPIDMHHLIMDSALSGKDVLPYLEQIGYRQDHFTNAVPLPSTPLYANFTELARHSGAHTFLRDIQIERFKNLAKAFDKEVEKLTILRGSLSDLEFARRYQTIVQANRDKITLIQDATREALVREPTTYLLIKKDAKSWGISDDQLKTNWNDLYNAYGIP